MWVLVKRDTGEYFSEPRGKEVILTREILCARKYPTEAKAKEQIRVGPLFGYDAKEVENND